MRIRESRESLGLKSKEAAEKLGISPVSYSRYETGERLPSLELLMQMSHLFGVSVDYLIENSDMSNLSLSSYEVELVYASRKVDERARKDALRFLNTYVNE